MLDDRRRDVEAHNEERRNRNGNRPSSKAIASKLSLANQNYFNNPQHFNILPSGMSTNPQKGVSK